ncbi:MAG: endonuclease [Planctomycetaceae bacterium]|nr:endonuclease [Planctomycetaceae bacterium]
MPINRRWFALLGIGLLLALSSPLTSGEADTGNKPLQLRVLSYNIHHGEGVDSKLDLPRIAEVVKSTKADLVALQEVDCGVERSERVDQPRELARLTGMHVVFGNNIRYQGGDYGNAVLSRFPIARHENHPLPALREGEQRGVIEVELDLPGSAGKLLFLATHFDYRSDEEERLASVRFINDRMAAQKDRPALLAGDLNALPDSNTLRLLEAAWTRANEKVLFTFPAEQPTRQIDYILFRPASRWKTIEVRVPDEPVASDHRPLLAVLEFAR